MINLVSMLEIIAYLGNFLMEFVFGKRLILYYLLMSISFSFLSNSKYEHLPNPFQIMYTEYLIRLDLFNLMFKTLLENLVAYYYK